MTLLSRACNLVTRAIPAKLVKSTLRRPVVSFTFDDFPKCAWTVGGAILGKYNARATYYVAGSRCGTFVDNTQQYSPEDLLALHAVGHEIGCHSFGHRSVPTVSSNEIRADVQRNANFLRQVLGEVTPLSFAYPYGDVDPRTKLLHARLFESSRGIRSGINAGVLDLALLRVVLLHEIECCPELLDMALASARSRSGWIIFLTHDVQAIPGPYGCTPETLERTVRRVLDASIEILPVKNALAFATNQFQHVTASR
jgi:peptidoglycan/xylan/chitin deacetylase (PgdA/CDA1 family)